MHALYLVEFDAWDARLQSERTLRYSNGAGYVTGPTSTLPNTYWAPRILQPINVSRHLFSRGSTMGRSSIGVGDLVLANGDGGLDFLLGLGLDGRRMVAWRTEEHEPRFPEDFQVVMVGTMQQPEVTGSVVRLALRDRQADVNVALQPVRYAGTNALPGGLEGVEADLKGKPKPVCLGVVRNIDPPLVNTARLIYQVNDGAVLTVDAVYDRGAALTKGADYVSQADMEANAPAAGAFRAWPAGGYFRLGSSPAGLVTADATQGNTAAERTAARMFEQLITRAKLVNPFADALSQVTLATSTGVDVVTDGGVLLLMASDVSQNDITALDAVAPAELGYWTKEETTVGDVCDLVAASVGAWWGVGREGLFRIARFTPPKPDAVPVMRITANDMLRPLDRLATADPGGGLPVYRQVVRWGHLIATQTGDLAGAVTMARRAQLAAEWREEVATDTEVQRRHLLAPEVVRDSLHVAATPAQAEAGRRLDMYNRRRDRFEVVVQLNRDTNAIDIGDTVAINHPRYGLNVVGSDDGVPFVVLGLEPDAANGRLTLNLWGSSTGRENLISNNDSLLITDTGVHITSQAA